ncbi:MAG: alpha/beta hydrolase [Verrucomicrobiae bacterium]|nr:alpha/beta hydrolase [Verrucomicrobiae bacterium]
MLGLLIFLSTGSGSGKEPVPHGRIDKSYAFTDAGKEVEYALFVPPGYTKSKPYPLLVLLHDYGSTPSKVMDYAGITDEAADRGFIVVAPFGYNERGWYGSRGSGKKGKRFGWDKDPDNLGELSEQDVINVLEMVEKEFGIDQQRRYLMGHGMGGGGAFHFAIANPYRWHGIAALSPAFLSDASELKKITQIPTITAANEKDENVASADVRLLATQLQNPETKHRYVELDDDTEDVFAQNPELISEIFDFLEGKFAGEDRERNEVYRVFANSEGKSIDAQLLSATGDAVTLRRMKDRKEFSLPLISLGEPDRVYVKGWLKRKRNRESIAALNKAMQAQPDPELEKKLVSRLQLDRSDPVAAVELINNEIVSREMLVNTMDDQTTTAFREGDEASGRMLQVKTIALQEELDVLRLLRSQWLPLIPAK